MPNLAALMKGLIKDPLRATSDTREKVFLIHIVRMLGLYVVLGNLLTEKLKVGLMFCPSISIVAIAIYTSSPA